MQKSVIWIATFFGLGKIPKMPGTFGTLGAIPVVYLFYLTGPIGYMGMALLLTFVAVFVSESFERMSQTHDAKEIVIDEVVGFVVAMTWLPLTWQSFLFAFLIFRILDIIKPPPIGTIDKKLKGGIGVVADDILAGVITNFILQVVFIKTNWLGYQLIEGM